MLTRQLSYLARCHEPPYSAREGRPSARPSNPARLKRWGRSVDFIWPISRWCHSLHIKMPNTNLYRWFLNAVSFHNQCCLMSSFMDGEAGPEVLILTKYGEHQLPVLCTSAEPLLCWIVHR